MDKKIEVYVEVSNETIFVSMTADKSGWKEIKQFYKGFKAFTSFRNKCSKDKSLVYYGHDNYIDTNKQILWMKAKIEGAAQTENMEKLINSLSKIEFINVVKNSKSE